MSDFPLVSVIIPTYNRAGLVKKALASVLNQTYCNLEIIVIDNASIDDTAEAVSSFGDSRIKFIRHSENKGPAASRNTGLKEASGEFVAFLDSDDEWLPEKTIRQLEIFKNSKEIIGLVFTNGYNEARKTDFIAKETPSGIYYHPRNDIFFPLAKLIATPSSWMLSQEVIRGTGYFDESMHTWDDGDYLARVAYKYPLYFLNENLVIWHAQGEHLNIMHPGLVSDKEFFLAKNFDSLKKDREYLFRFYRALGKDALGFDRPKARRYLWEALQIQPWDFSTLGKFLRTF